MKVSRGILSCAVVIVVIAIVLAVKFFMSSSAGQDVGPRFKGNSQAAVQIQEFTDFQCPACARAAPVLNELLQKYEGRIGLTHQHYPLKMHKHAKQASLAAECAYEQGEFWPMHDVLFKSQVSWAKMKDPSSYFVDLAVGLGMDGEAMRSCMTDEATKAVVDQDVEQGKALGVRGTPTFVINGKLFVGTSNLKKELEARLGP